MTHRTIEADELKARLDGAAPPVLLDVLSANAWEEKRLPGARNACVYEMGFLDHVAAQVPDRGVEIVVHCSREECHASRDAMSRLAGAGYTNLVRFPGGREAWEAAGLPFEGERPGEAWRPSTIPAVADRDYAVDIGESLVEWTGRNVANRHFGSLRLRGGTVEVRNGLPAGGAVEIDMRSMEAGDLDGEMAALLVAHLESEDFFAVERFPAARIEITGARPIEGAAPGGPTCTVSGDLTVRDVTAAVDFDAVVASHGDGGLAVQAVLEMDRVRWGATYGSGRLYDRLGMHLVNDLVTLQVRVVAG